MKFKGTKKYVSTEDLSMAVNASVTLETVSYTHLTLPTKA